MYVLWQKRLESRIWKDEYWEDGNPLSAKAESCKCSKGLDREGPESCYRGITHSHPGKSKAQGLFYSLIHHLSFAKFRALPLGSIKLDVPIVVVKNSAK